MLIGFLLIFLTGCVKENNSNVSNPKKEIYVSNYIFETRTSEVLVLDENLNLVKALFIEVNPIPIKAAMNLMGFNVGKPRMPLTEMEPANQERLKKEMNNCNIKTVA